MTPDFIKQLLDSMSSEEILKLANTVSDASCYLYQLSSAIDKGTPKSQDHPKTIASKRLASIYTILMKTSNKYLEIKDTAIPIPAMTGTNFAKFIADNQSCTDMREDILKRLDDCEAAAIKIAYRLKMKGIADTLPKDTQQTLMYQTDVMLHILTRIKDYAQQSNDPRLTDYLMELYEIEMKELRKITRGTK